MSPFRRAMYLLVTFAVVSNGSRVTQSARSEIVNLHNRLRSTVAATNMQALRWSTEAATEAQRWADTCPTGTHSSRRISGFSSCGQNMSWRSGSSVTWTPAIMQWYNEKHKFRYCAAPSGEVGHYTQLMWAETSVVGCGVNTNCRGGTLYVCNYCNAGNVMRQGNRNSRYCPWRQ